MLNFMAPTHDRAKGERPCCFCLTFLEMAASACYFPLQWGHRSSTAVLFSCPGRFCRATLEATSSIFRFLGGGESMATVQNLHVNEERV
mmetsp:Transcript_16585/g.43605  ORF Transcript_16585/g.43605 Transcript_16585/m.43605 type:complete len:89 (+) Transcript_16585:1566-1832(+)